MLRDLIESITDLWTPWGGDPEKQVARENWKRANTAYAAVWKIRGDADQLRAEMQARNVPGSFAAADPVLQPYFDAWALGTDPAIVRAESRRALSSK